MLKNNICDYQSDDALRIMNYELCIMNYIKLC